MTDSTHLSMLWALQQSVSNDTIWFNFQAQYSPLIRAGLVSAGVHANDVDDLTQAILLRLSQHLPKFRFDPSQGSFRSWLATVVRNTVIDFQRSQARRKDRAVGGTTALQALEREAVLEDVAGCLETEFHSQLQDALDAVRARVKPHQWQAFWLSTVDGI